MLRKKRLWYILSLVVQSLMLLYCWVYDRIYGALWVKMPAGYHEMIFIWKLVGLLGGMYLVVYYAYRLLYLYRKTEARKKWTVINVCFMIAVGLAIYDRNEPLLFPFLTIHMLLPYIISILGLLCVWHDYEIVYSHGR